LPKAGFEQRSSWSPPCVARIPGMSHWCPADFVYPCICLGWGKDSKLIEQINQCDKKREGHLSKAIVLE
jgi:hypothetical protein